MQTNFRTFEISPRFFGEHPQPFIMLVILLCLSFERPPWIPKTCPAPRVRSSVSMQVPDRWKKSSPTERWQASNSNQLYPPPSSPLYPPPSNPLYSPPGMAPPGMSVPGQNYNQPLMGQQPYNQPPMSQQPYGQPPMNQPYDQPPMNQPPMNQPPMNQPPMNQPPMNQPYGQSGMGQSGMYNSRPYGTGAYESPSSSEARARAREMARLIAPPFGPPTPYRAPPPPRGPVYLTPKSPDRLDSIKDAMLRQQRRQMFSYGTPYQPMPSLANMQPQYVPPKRPDQLDSVRDATLRKQRRYGPYAGGYGGGGYGGGVMGGGVGYQQPGMQSSYNQPYQPPMGGMNAPMGGMNQQPYGSTDNSGYGSSRGQPWRPS